MKRPPYLQKGNKVALVAPARKVTEEEMRPAIAQLKDWGLEVVEGKNLYAEADQFAGTDEERAEDLQWALDDKNIKAIFCARGGYGSMRIIDRLDFTTFSTSPKWMVGYSDITTFHTYINQVLGIESLHAEMLVNFDKKPESIAKLKEALFDGVTSYSFDMHPLNKTGKCNGRLVGGNLSMLYALNNSPSDLVTVGRILFIEDLDEYLYHIDRMLVSLKRSGKLSELSGLLVGGMSDMNDNAIPFGKNAIEIIREQVDEYDFPVYFNFPAGHIKTNMPIYLGREITLSSDAGYSTLEFAT